MVLGADNLIGGETRRARRAWLVAFPCLTWVLLLLWLLEPREVESRELEDRPLPTGLDYDASNSEWNGLSELARILRGLIPTVRINQPIELSELSTDTPLALIYPLHDELGRGLPVVGLVQFVRDGGQLLLADDFGVGAELMRAFGLEPRVGRVPHGSFYYDNPNLPYLHHFPESPLTRGVRRLVANHPLPLAWDHPAVVPYDTPGFGLLYDLRIGEGRALVLGDPSMLINFMLNVADNRTFVLNLFHELCVGRIPCDLRVLSREHRFVGEYPAPAEVVGERHSREALASRLVDAIDRFNRRVTGLSQPKPNPDGVYLGSLLLAISVVALLFLLLPLSRPGWLSFSLSLSESAKCRSEYEWNLERYTSRAAERDYLLPLSILKDEFEDLFFSELVHSQSECDVPPEEELAMRRRLARRYARRVLPRGGARELKKAEARAYFVLKSLARIPNREILVPGLELRYSERQFKRLWMETRRLLHDLNILEKYERRISRPPVDRAG